MESSETYRDVLYWAYPLFWALAFVSQLFVMYIILFHTPKLLQGLRGILMFTCFCQTIHVFVCCTMEFRQVSNLVPMEIWSYGIGRHLPAWAGYILYHILQSATFVSGISVVTTLFMKYEAARITKIRKRSRRLILGFIFAFPFLSMAMEVILVTFHSIPADIRKRYEFINANVSDHSVVGVVDFKILASAANTCIMSSSVILLPGVGLFSRKKILQHIRQTENRVSASKLAQNKIFVKGLTIQTFLPLCFYCPVSLVYFYCIFTRQEVLFQQFFMFLTPAFPSLCDPYITIYFVTPYRNTIKEWFGLQNKISPKSVTLVHSVATQ